MRVLDRIIGLLTVEDKKHREEWEADQKRIECLLKKIAVMQKNLRMFKEFWDNSAEAFLLVRKDDGQILEVNPTFSSLYGFSREELLGMTMDGISAEPECTKTVADESIKFVPHRLHINKSGTMFPITATISYFNDQGYDVCACIIRPVVERRIVDQGED